MEEITQKKEYGSPEIRVIDPTRTSLVPVRMDPRPIRKRRDLAALGLEIALGVSVGLNVFFMFWTYILMP